MDQKVKSTLTTRTRDDAHSILSGGTKSPRAYLAFLGPAVVASIAYTDPGNFATNIQAGSQYGYNLLWVVLMANLVAMLFQALSAKLGIVTGRNLAEMCRDQFSKPVAYAMWVASEIAAMATDLAEFLGGAIGLSLLFGLPLLWGMVIVAIVISGILAFEQRGFRPIELVVGALVAVAHDIVISVGVYSLFQLEVTPATVVAFLTILGFSLYDTIVVFDKVKENQARVGLANRTTYTGLMNLSLNQTLMRSVNTTVVTVVPVLSILLIGAVLLGAVTLEEFGFALLIGLVSGAYSSIVVASSLVAALKEREPRNRQLRERLERSYDGAVPVTGIRHATPAAMRPAATAAASVGGSPASSSGASRGPGVDRPAGGTAIPPRPRKKKRR